MTNSISGKVGTLTLIEYLYKDQIRDYQYLSGGRDADLYSSRKYHYLSGFRDTDLGDNCM